MTLVSTRSSAPGSRTFGGSGKLGSVSVGMAAYNDLMIRREGIAAAWRPTAVLLAYGLGYLVIGLALFRRRALRTR